MSERSETDEAMEDAAIAWYVRLKDRRAGPADREAFQRWLDEDPANARTYGEIDHLWDLTGAPAERLSARGWHRRSRPRLAPVLAVAAAVMLIVAGVLWRDPGLVDRAVADMATAPGERRMEDLPDGSRLFLDADSAVSVDFRPGDRRVTLLRGRAWFDVERRPDAPFTVIAGTIETRVLGTAFAVARHGKGTTVTVESGAVGVGTGADGPFEQLAVGQRLTLGPSFREGPVAVDPETALAWRRGLIVFDRARLADVVAELQRMAPGRFVVVGDDLGRTTLSGVFRADDPQAVLAALRATMGVRSTAIPGFTTLLHR